MDYHDLFLLAFSVELGNWKDDTHTGMVKSGWNYQHDRS